MAIKIEIIGNALICTNTVSTLITIAQPTKGTWYDEERLQSGVVQFYDSSDTDGKNAITEDFPLIFLADAVDDALTPFTEETFRNFSVSNLGK